MNRGFTLIEVLLALALICFVMSGVTKLLVLTLKTGSYADRQTCAAMLGGQKIADLEALAYTDGALAPVWHADPDNPITVDDCSYNCFWAVDEAASMKRVDLYVVWHDGGQELPVFTSAGQLEADGINKVHLNAQLLR